MSILDDAAKKLLTVDRWPLLIPIVGSPAWYTAWQHYNGYSTRQMVWDYTLWFGIGLLLMSGAAIWGRINFPKWIVIAVSLMMLGFACTVPKAYAYLAGHLQDTKVLAAYAPELADLQVHSGDSSGGFRTSRFDSSSTAQVWTTAQAIVALAASRQSVEANVFRSAWKFIESRRQEDGLWGYWSEIDLPRENLAPSAGAPDTIDALVKRYGSDAVQNIVRTVRPGFILPPDLQNISNGNYVPTLAPRSVTEIAAWVTLAYVHALEVHNVWSEEERILLANSIRHDLSRIAARQNKSTDSVRHGGISPIQDVRFPRTYSTIMALWAMLEAREGGVIGKEHDEDIVRALRWLLDRKHVAGWVPNPLRQGQEGPARYPGLTAQAIFVLYRAAAQGFLNGDRPRFLSARKTFVAGLGDMENQALCANDAVSDLDQHLNELRFQLEGSSFAWVAWTRAALFYVLRDSDLTDAERNAAATTVAAVKRHSSTHFETLAGTWEFSENIYCVAVSDGRDEHSSGK
jgi:hypothetical protein